MAADKTPTTFVSWIKFFIQRVGGKPTAVAIAIFFSVMTFAIWAYKAQAPALIFTFMAGGQIGAFARIGSLKLSSHKRYSASIDARSFLQELVSGVFVLGGAWSIIGATLINGHLVNWLTQHFHKVDGDLLLASEVASISCIGMLILEVLVKRQLWLGLPAFKRDKEVALMHESAWLIGLIVLALIPAAFLSSWLLNVLAGVVLPVIVLYARDDYHEFKEEEQRKDEPQPCSPPHDNVIDNNKIEVSPDDNNGMVISSRPSALDDPILRKLRFLTWAAYTGLVIGAWSMIILIPFGLFMAVIDPIAMGGSELERTVQQTQIHVTELFGYILFSRVFGAIMTRWSAGLMKHRHTILVIMFPRNK